MTLYHSWHMNSWKNYLAEQQPDYEDEVQLRLVLDDIKKLPPLVDFFEIEALKQSIAFAAEGRCFIFQGGDCAERFQDCHEETIASKFHFLREVSVLLSHALHRDVVTVGRIAGQFAKPRSSHYEWVSGEKIPVFRGDNVNSIVATREARTHDPKRLLLGYHNASSTLNYLRILSSRLQDAEGSLRGDRFFWNLRSLSSKHSFVQARAQKLYISHEGLILPFETSLTRWTPHSKKHYNLGAHMLWIGERTRSFEGAHVEYFSGIHNPIGIKVGPDVCIEELLRTLEKINPHHEKGKILLITRLGVNFVGSLLPILIQEIKKHDLNVCWSCDPMHGNTFFTPQGIKTRSFHDIYQELKETLVIHESMNSILGGLHLEMTGENVTECLGGSSHIEMTDLGANYTTYCDPRLNYSQSLELCALIKDFFKKRMSYETGYFHDQVGL